MKQEFKIRKARLADLGRLVELQKEFNGFYNKIDRSRFNIVMDLKKNINNPIKKELEKEIRSRNKLFLVVETNKGIVAYIRSKVEKCEDFFKFKNVGKIMYLFVIKKYRARGISSALRDRVYSWFREKGVGWISIEVHKNNRSAEKIYKKWGFGEFETIMWRRFK
jgi:ribosomal protein S18 acetylase RimI-like enzyme